MNTKSVYCCGRHGHVPAAQACSSHGHLLDSLYPRSQYRCSGCGAVHGTRALNGAVNWGCPTCASHPEQTYVGQICGRCAALVNRLTPPEAA